MKLQKVWQRQDTELLNSSGEELYAIGQSLASLREEGFLIFASGNIVHNLGRVEWDNEDVTALYFHFEKQN
jgi:4,5-DOPA dioxygenase extradiol